VNETLAARFWPGQALIGKRLVIPRFSDPPWQVVGVAKDGKYLAVFEKPLPYFYVPMAQNPTFLRAIEVRASAMPIEELQARMSREITSLEPDMPIADLHPLREMIEGNIGFVLFRVGVWQATAMSALGLVLAIGGVYGVVSYRTAQRGREIGIRVALGAMPRDVRRLVLRQGAGLVGGGLLIGVLFSFGVSQSLTKVIVLVDTTDPVTFAIVPLVVGVTALVACYLPARRAMRVQPAEILRHE
jgi:FtsX-like permease family